MMLSCDVWGMRSLLCSTFFNADIECNLVSAWMNPAFAIINPLVQEEIFTMLTKFLVRRSPKLGSLWLGAALVGIARSSLRDIRIGLMVLELNASAWTEVEQSFITRCPCVSDGIQSGEKTNAAYYLSLAATDTLGRPFTHGSLLESFNSETQRFQCKCMLIAATIL